MSAAAASPAKPHHGDGGVKHYDATEHKMSVSELKQALETNLDEGNPKESAGLTVADAAARLKKNGPNAMTPPRTTPEIVKYLHQFVNPFMILLMLASILSYIAYSLDMAQKVNLYCAIALDVIVVLQCTASYLEERKSASVMSSLKSMMPSQCSVVREGKPRKINASELVVGDVVQLKGGDKVPADIRLIQTSGLKVESSSLTGEPDAFEMAVNATHEEPHESKNLCFNTSQCTEGSAVGVVVRTGDKTLIGMVATLATATNGNVSTLKAELNRIVIFITGLAMALALIILIIGVTQKVPTVIVANLVITVFVANVPQGLPATVTSCLGIAAKRMFLRNVLVKNLEVIETLGCASCICSDKTGTLTQNKMSVQNFWYNGSFEMLQGAVVVGSTSAVASGVAIGYARSNVAGLKRVTSDGGRAPAQGTGVIGGFVPMVSGESPQPGNTGVFGGLVRMISGDAPQPGTSGVIGGLVRMISGDAPPKRESSGPLRRFTSGTAEVDESRAILRWKANPLEPLLLVAAVCNSARFAADKDEAEPKKDQQSKTTPPPAIAPIGKPSSTEQKGLPTGHYDQTNVQQNLDNLKRVMSGDTPAAPVAVTSRLEKPRPMTQEVIGDASESALLRYCDSIYPIEKIRKLYPIKLDVPFNSTNKYALCVVTPPPGEADGKQYVFLKGAPEVVIERCSKWRHSDQDSPIDEAFKTRFLAAYERFAHMGERVLGFARLVIDAKPGSELTEKTVPNRDFVFLGIASLMDPPKVGVDKAVEQCRQAGIRVFMVTGDHALTAEAIAHKVNIITMPTRADLAQTRGVSVESVDPNDPEIGAIVVTGTDLRTLDEEGWDALLNYQEIVFARTTPQQKLEIVTRLQNKGEVVAVTGDGVNDAPALKKAQIGVAMGNPNASDVAREAADIIILDDDFCSIVNAIREGRLLFDNLKKSIAYTLTHLVPEMVPVFLNIILLMPLGLASMLILTIDLGSELIPAISLAYEDAESAIMLRPPRDIKNDKMVTWQVLFHSYLAAGVMEAVASILAFFCIFWSYGIDIGDIIFPDASNYWTETAPDFHSGGKVFTAAEQVTILSIGNAAVYGNIIFCQMFHLWFVRTRTTSVTQHPLFSNKLAILAMFWEFCFIMIFCYVPQLTGVFTSGFGLPPQFWCLSLGFLVWIAVHSEVLKYSTRRTLAGHKSFLARFAW